MIKEFIKENEGKQYKFIEVDNGNNLKITFCDIGAAIYSVYYKGKLMTFTPNDFDYFIKNGMHYGKVIGRVAGRIKNGCYSINGKEHRINDDNQHVLHSGFGFQWYVFDLDYDENENEVIVHFDLLSKTMDQGLPGELHVDVYYHIFKKEDAFEIEFKAISSEDTYCNLTNHVYWNLEGDNTRDILEEKLIINADKYVDIDQELIINDIIPVNEIFDFRQGMKFKEHMKDAAAMYPCASGYDHDYILNDTSLACILFSSDENIVLKVYTDNPVCHLFTQNPIPENERYHAVALEMQKEVFFLDKILLKKNELYHQTTKYVFES